MKEVMYTAILYDSCNADFEHRQASMGPSQNPGFPWHILIIFTTIQMFFSGVINSSSVLSSFIIDDMGFSKAQIGFAGSAACVGQALSSMLFGHFVDRGYAHKIFLICCGAIGCCIFFASGSDSYSSFLFWLIFTGFWCSISTPYGVKSVSEKFPAKHISFALSVRQTGVPLGTLLVSLLLPAIAQVFNWRIAMICAGAILVFNGVFHYFSYIRRNQTQDCTPQTVNEEIKSADRDLSFLRKSNYWQMLLAGSIYMGVQYVLITHLPLFFHEQYGYSVIISSVCLAVSQLGGGFGRIFLGYLSDRYYHSRCRPLLIIEGMIMIGVLLILLIWRNSMPLVIALLISLIFGVSAMGWNGLHVTMATKYVSCGNRGLSTGILQTVLQFGVILIPTLFGYIVDITSSYSASFAGSCLMILIALFLLYRSTELDIY